MTMHSPDFERMRGSLMKDVERRQARRRTRRRAGLFAGVGAVIVATSGAALIALASGELRENAANCYATASLSGAVQLVGDPSPVGDSRTDRAIDLCESVWRACILGADDTDQAPSDSGRVYPVPALFVCLQRDGTMAVFPQQDGVTCAQLGLESSG